MAQEPLYKIFSKYFKYNNMSNFNPIKPFTIWFNTNDMLDEYYNRPDINIKNNTQGLNYKNSMRHIVGPALMTQEYNPTFTKYMGGLKEAKDFYSGQPLEDQFVDLRNNWRGINYIEQNPHATQEQILQYAFDEAKKNYEQDYNSSSLYELLLGKSRQ